MFRKINCPKCNQPYDEMKQNCPHCNEPNEKVPQHKFFGNKATFVPFWLEIVLFAVGWLGFQVLGLVLSLVIKLAPWDVIVKEAVLTFSAYGLLGGIMIAISCKHLKELALSFKKWLVPVSAIVGFIAILTFNMVYGSIIKLIHLDISDNANETSINSITTVYPLLSILIIGLVGPLCEELTYRVGFYSFFRRINKYLAYALTMVFFAFIHFDFEAFSIGGATLINEFLNLPYYLAAAFVFTFLYEKIGFGASFACHATNNLASVLSTLLLSKTAFMIL
ncbi:MAG: CPBP family intramembrane metalloprotease [Bacilli bacterium]|nr:CPBP family intramembrane metalloprotease [Bacilli bacterium]